MRYHGFSQCIGPHGHIYQRPGLCQALDWDLNANITDLEDTLLLLIRLNFCNGNLEVGQFYLTSFQDFQSLQNVQALQVDYFSKNCFKT